MVRRPSRAAATGIQAQPLPVMPCRAMTVGAVGAALDSREAVTTSPPGTGMRTVRGRTDAVAMMASLQRQAGTGRVR